MAGTGAKLAIGAVVGVAASLGVCAGLCQTMVGHGMSADAPTSSLERRLAAFLLERSIPESYRSVENQMPNTPLFLHEGMEHFADHCAACHANDGSGDTALGRGLSPRPPDLRLPGTQKKSDGELYYIIEHGIRMTGMPAFRQPGDEYGHASWNLVTFIRHLPQLTPEEELQMRKANPISPRELREQQLEDEFLRSSEGGAQ